MEAITLCRCSGDIESDMFGRISLQKYVILPIYLTIITLNLHITQFQPHPHNERGYQSN